MPKRILSRWSHYSRWVIAVALLLLACGYHLSLGDMPIHLSDLTTPESSLAKQIFWQLRVPRVLAAVLVGASLAASGAVLQTLLHNPLAEPGLLGIASGASLIAVSLMVLSAILGWSIPIWGMTAGAFIGALIVAIILFALARHCALSGSALLLFGVVIGIITGAGLTWLIYFSPNQNLRQLLYWMMGSLSFANAQVYHLWPLFIVVFGVLLRDTGALNFILLGERYAFAQGIDVRRVRARLVLWVALLSAIAVACAGTISFIGLLVPHLIRSCLGG